MDLGSDKRRRDSFKFYFPKISFNNNTVLANSFEFIPVHATFSCRSESSKYKLGRITGCSSNTRGFSNSVSDLLESVNKANQDPYECISSEDKLSRIEKYNQEAAKIM